MAKSYKREDKAFAAHVAQEADALAAKRLKKDRENEKARERRNQRAWYKENVRACNTTFLINHLLKLVVDLSLEPRNTHRDKRLSFEYVTILAEVEKRLRAAKVIGAKDEIGVGYRIS